MKQLIPMRYKIFLGYRSTRNPEKGLINNKANAYDDRMIPILELSILSTSVRYKGIVGIKRLKEQAVRKLAMQAIIKFLFHKTSFAIQYLGIKM